MEIKRICVIGGGRMGRQIALDAAMEYGFNYKMGPFRTQDISGFHVTYAALKREYEKTGKKPDMFDYYTRMIEEGRLGKAVGKGFYDYN